MDNNRPTLPGSPPPQTPIRPRLRPATLWLIVAMIVLLAFMLFSRGNGNRTEISYDFFWKQLNADNVTEVTFDNQSLLLGRFKKIPEAPPKPAATPDENRFE